MPEKWLGTAAIMIACAAVVLLGVMKKKMEWLLNLVMRSILGIIGIYFINSFLESAGIRLEVGINAFTILTSGILGFPGVLALYGIGLYKIL